MRLTSGGFLGIGTTSPSSPLTVAGRVDFQGDLRLRGTDSLLNQGVVRFYVDSNNKLYIDTANDGANLFAIDSSGQVTIPATPVASTDAASKSYVDAQVGSADTLSEVLANGNTTGGTNISVNDNDKITFGTSADLQIYHNGSNSIIEDVGTGHLLLRGGIIAMENAAGTENLATFLQDGAVELYCDNSKKFETTSNGANIYGNLLIGTTTDSGEKLQVDGTSKFSNQLIVSSDTGGDASWDNSGILIENTSTTTGEPVLAFKNAGAEGTGSNYWFTGLNQKNIYQIAYGTNFTDANTKFKVLSSGIEVISKILISDNTTDRPKLAFSENTANDDEFIIEYNGAGAGAGNYVAFYSDISGWIGIGDGFNYIPQNGRVGIGTNSPTEKLHVVGDSLITGDSHADAFKPAVSGNPIKFKNFDSSTEFARITDDGKLLIATTTTPPTQARVSIGDGTTANMDVFINKKDNKSSGYYIASEGNLPGRVSFFRSSSGEDAEIGTTNTNELKFFTNDTEVAQFTSGGNLLIGTTTDSGVYKLDVFGKARVQSVFELDDVLTLNQISTPADPQSGQSSIYMDSADGAIKCKINVGGTVVTRTIASFE